MKNKKPIKTTFKITATKATWKKILFCLEHHYPNHHFHIDTELEGGCLCVWSCHLGEPGKHVARFPLKITGRLETRSYPKIILMKTGTTKQPTPDKYAWEDVDHWSFDEKTQSFEQWLYEHDFPGARKPIIWYDYNNETIYRSKEG